MDIIAAMPKGSQMSDSLEVIGTKNHIYVNEAVYRKDLIVSE
jgi:hypothetical protein